MKKTLRLLAVMILVIMAGSLVMLGCANPADGSDGAAGLPGKEGSGGEKGTDGPIYLSGSVTTDGINDALASGTSVVFAGVTQSDEGTVIIPANRTGGAVKLVGTAAYKSYTSAGGILIVEDVSSVYGNGGLASGHADSPVVVPEGVEASGTTVVRIQDGSEVIVPAASFAVKGNVTISGDATSATNILNTALTTQNLYVVGDVEVSAAIGGAAKITVTGDAEVTATQTTAVVWNIKGDLDAQKLPTTGAGTLTVGGKADFAEAVTGITGAIEIGGKATFSNALTTTTGAVTVGSLEVTGAASLGAGGLTVNGAAEFKSTLTNTAASTATFNGATTVTGALTSGAALTIAGTGAVALTVAPTLTNGLIVTNTTGVTIPSATIVASTSIDASAGKVTFGTADNSVTIEKGTLASAAQGLVTVAVNGVVGLVFNTNAASLELADGGSIAIAGDGKVTIGATAELKGAGSKWTAGTDTVTFEPTAAATAKIAGGTSATLTPSGAAAELRLLSTGAAQALTISGNTKFTLDLSSTGKITFEKTTTGSTITLTAKTDGIKLSDSLAIVGSNDASGSSFTGAFVDGTTNYNDTSCNVSLVDGVITHTSTNDAAPAAIDKTTTAASLAKATS